MPLLRIELRLSVYKTDILPLYYKGEDCMYFKFYYA